MPPSLPCAFSRFRLCSALAALLCLLCALPAAAGPVDAKSAILMDVTTGRILYEQYADRRIPPASLTKVLSMYVAMDAISAHKASYNSKVKVSRNAARTRGSSMFLKTGDMVTLDKLFYGMAVASGNDASAAVAEHIAGSESAFVQRMNSLARRLGMKNSRFKNVHGMPAEGQYTTARDMLTMARSYEAKYPRARKYHLAKSITHNRKTEPNHNPLVGYYRGLNGLKTGWVTAAGYNIIVSARRDGHKLIGVILGAPNTGVRAAEARRLLNAGFKSIGRKKTTVYAELGVSDRQARRFASSSYTPLVSKKKAVTAKRPAKKSEAAMKKERSRSKTRAQARAEQKRKAAQAAASAPKKIRSHATTAEPSTAQKDRTKDARTKKNAAPPVKPAPPQPALSPAEQALADLKAASRP
ncbi:D-alanyl-D-alanine carboxypeptidase family protein [Mailhella sp.]|uniref:D-alanyl-D-alanine carboxypeptidase family protein n=1 Tax=Mailhella sp. TaxID=1981029 RepID=UPI004063A9E0